MSGRPIQVDRSGLNVAGGTSASNGAASSTGTSSSGASNSGASNGGSPSRADLAAAIHAELAFVVRRFRAQSADIHPGLSLTAFTLLLHLEETGGSRAADLVESYSLNKSTVSRQLAELAAGGLVDRELDARDSRVQIVRIRPAGQAVLAEISERFQQSLRDRMDAWPESDLAAFAVLLQRYNGRTDPTSTSPAPTTSPATETSPAAST
nr:MarR family winged helix-turn-helix transcriptional regulator [Micromonospora sp. DSM 115978]